MTNDDQPPDDYRARQQAGLIVQRLATLDGVTIRESGHRSAVSLVADEIRDLLQLIDEGTAQTVRAALNPAMRPPLSANDTAAIAEAVQARYESILKSEGSATGSIKLHLTELAAAARKAEIALESANANLWRLERREREHVAKVAQLQAELDEMHARMDDTDIATEPPADPLIIEEGPLWIEQMMQEGRDNG